MGLFLAGSRLSCALACARLPFARHLATLFASFTQANRNRLLSAGDFPARAARLQRAVLPLVHRAFDFALRLLSVLGHAHPSSRGYPRARNLSARVVNCPFTCLRKGCQKCAAEVKLGCGGEAMRAAIAAVILSVTITSVQAADLSTREVSRVQEAALVLKEIHGVPDKDIPQDLWDRAACVMVVPGLKKAAFIVGG